MASEFLLIGNEIERRKINVNSILYVKIDDYLSTFFLTNNQKFICSKSLSEIMAYFPDHFFKINRAYIVNLDEVLSVQRNIRKIILTDATELKVSLRRMKSFNVALARQNMAVTS
ncbi:MAG: LytTR family DNA-binding domain-containing protein [Ignavibacteria bacterium]|nr:LytTR family DNA-binding domain-containing protein [Ignavibacteria bacterium]